MSISISTSFCSCFPPRWVMFSWHSILLIHNYTSCWWYTTHSFRPAIQHLANERSIANELWVDGSPLLNVRRASFFNVHACLMCYMLSSGCFLKTKMIPNPWCFGIRPCCFGHQCFVLCFTLFYMATLHPVVILVATASKGGALKWSKQGETFRSDKQLKWLATNFVATNCCTLFIGNTWLNIPLCLRGTFISFYYQIIIVWYLAHYSVL